MVYWLSLEQQAGLERKSGQIGSQGKPTQTMRLENEAAKSTGKQMFEIQLWQILRPMSFNDEWQISYRNLGQNNRSHFKRDKGNRDATTVLHKSMQNGTNKTRKEQLKTVGPQFAPERSLCMMGWQGKIHDKPIEHVIFVILSGAVCSLELCVCFVQFHSFCDPGFKMKRAERSAMAAFELCAWVRK